SGKYRHQAPTISHPQVGGCAFGRLGPSHQGLQTEKYGAWYSWAATLVRSVDCRKPFARYPLRGPPLGCFSSRSEQRLVCQASPEAGGPSMHFWLVRAYRQALRRSSCRADPGCTGQGEVQSTGAEKIPEIELAPRLSG